MQHSQMSAVSHPTSAPPKMKAPPPPPKMTSNMGKHGHNQNSMARDQKDRSLTVMIPRAKYHPHAQPAQQPAILLINSQQHAIDGHHPILVQTNSQQPISFEQHSSLQTQMTIGRTDSLCSASEAKLLSYLDASPSTSKVVLICVILV